MSARWYVVHTQTNGETRADEHLRRQGFKTFLPVFLKRRRHARKTETVKRPLFPRYMFVQIDTAAQGWHAIRSTAGVNGLVGGEAGPIPVQQGVVESLSALQKTDGHVRVPAQRKFLPGASIRVVDGLFASALGLFESMSDNDRVSVLLDLLGRRVRVVLDSESVASA
jgi:transcriptional antiterminator RfaH